VNAGSCDLGLLALDPHLEHNLHPSSSPPFYCNQLVLYAICSVLFKLQGLLAISNMDSLPRHYAPSFSSARKRFSVGQQRTFGQTSNVRVSYLTCSMYLFSSGAMFLPKRFQLNLFFSVAVVLPPFQSRRYCLKPSWIVTSPWSFRLANSNGVHPSIS